MGQSDYEYINALNEITNSNSFASTSGSENEFDGGDDPEESPATFPDLTPQDLELDLDDFALSPRTLEFFTKLAGFVTCKLRAEALYADPNRFPQKLLERPEFDSFGTSPAQEFSKKHSIFGSSKNAFVTVPEVLEDAGQKKPEFDRLLRRITVEQGLDPDREVLVNGEPIEKPWGRYRVLTLAELKSEERAREKTTKEYGGNAKHLCDAGRATIVCSTEEELSRMLQALRQECEVVRLKNRFAHPTYTGTRDILMNVRVENHVFEIQIHQKDLLAWDAIGGQHSYYEYFREYFVGTAKSYQTRMEIFDKLGEAVRTGDITAEIRAILDGEDMGAIYALQEITSPEIFSDLGLHLMALKREQTLREFGGASYDEKLRCLHNMARIYNLQGNHKKSLEFYERALKGRELTHGKNHPVTLRVVDNMAQVCVRKGMYKKALGLLRRVLESKTTIGLDIASISSTINSMAVAHMQQQNYDVALELFGRALKGFEESNGKDHPDTLMTVSNMAIVYGEQQKYEKSLEFYDRALKGRESALGKDHPDTLSTVNSKAAVYAQQDKFEEALILFDRVLTGAKLVYGKSHIFTMITRNNIGAVYFKQKKYGKALTFYGEVLKDIESHSSLGMDHPEFLQTVYNMALTYGEQANYEKALAFYRRALTGWESTFERNHPLILCAAWDIANCLEKTGRKSELLAHLGKYPDLRMKKN